MPSSTSISRLSSKMEMNSRFLISRTKSFCNRSRKSNSEGCLKILIKVKPTIKLIIKTISK